MSYATSSHALSAAYDAAETLVTVYREGYLDSVLEDVDSDDVRRVGALLEGLQDRVSNLETSSGNDVPRQEVESYVDDLDGLVYKVKQALGL